MLERLSIRNYALIDTLQIDFAEGLSIITGETGAGKSVMMGALGLLTGERADTKVLGANGGKATVEASFDRVNASLKLLFEHLDLDWNDGEVIVRREIAAGGRSRAFVNDTPVTLPVLGQVTQQLIDIHSQNSNRLLSTPEYQLDIIDSMAGNAELRMEYKATFRKYVELRSRLRKMRENSERSRENNELLRFQLQQLESLAPKKGELAEIEKRFDLLSDAEEQRNLLFDAYGYLDGTEDSAVTLIANAKSRLDSFPEIADRLNQVYIELRDIANTVADLGESVDSDPLELEKLSTRMHDLYEAQKRFRVTECDALVELRDQIASQLSEENANPAEMKKLEEEARKLGLQLKDQADKLSAVRREAADRFADRLTVAARPLGLKNICFKVGIEKGKLTPSGQDQVEFLCSFNKNQQPMPMAKIASGGEMSRLTLTIKGMMADKLRLPTVIFDEIDTGVSGEIADKMGEMMEKIARNMQVVAITHLPQVAAKGNSHYMVYKTDLKDRTVSNVRRLSGDERVKELARMLSGRKLNEAAIQNARSLLELK